MLSLLNFEKKTLSKHNGIDPLIQSRVRHYISRRLSSDDFNELNALE